MYELTMNKGVLETLLRQDLTKIQIKFVRSN